MMGINTIASETIKIVREYMREQARELGAGNCDIKYGHTVFDDVKSIDAYVYPYGEDLLRAFIVLSDSYGDVLDIHSDVARLDDLCRAAVVGAGYWAQQFVEEHFAGMWGSARSLIEERERVKRLEEIRDDVECSAMMDD